MITFSPVSTGLAIRASVDQASPQYRETVARLSTRFAALRMPAGEKPSSATSYEDLESDDVDLRLCVFEASIEDASETLRFHVFPGAYAIVEHEFDPPPVESASAIEAGALANTQEAVEASRGQLQKLLSDLRGALPRDWLDSDADVDLSIAWTARALVFDPGELSNHDTLIEEWLAHTARPEDAGALKAGDIDHSMTWLNYVIATDDPRRLRMLRSAMRISQFFYARQNSINDSARTALARAYSTADIRESQVLLARARSDIQLLRIQFDSLSSLLNRNKRRIIDDIMQVWDYPRLVNNGHRMVEASTSRIQEITAQRAERSSFVTDLILTVITFLAVIDVSLTLSQYSREVMSRPVLEYQDRDMSWILSGVAAVDTDRVLIGGAVGVLILLLLYAYWKLRK